MLRFPVASLDFKVSRHQGVAKAKWPDLMESRTGGGVAYGLEHGNSAVMEERL